MIKYFIMVKGNADEKIYRYDYGDVGDVGICHE